MAVKNFVFRENWVGSNLAGMKATIFAIFAIFDPTWAHILALKGPNKEFLKQYSSFQSIRKTEVVLLSILWLQGWITKVKF